MPISLTMNLASDFEQAMDTSPPHSHSSSPSTEFSSRGRPPIPQGPRNLERRSTSNTLSVIEDITIDTKNLGVWNFPQLPGPLDAGPEFTDSPLWKMPNLSPMGRPFTQPVPLTPPSPLSFDPPPLPYKGLPLSVAEWTFTSSELQEIVSRAIRQSSRESDIRLLSVSTTDDVLPQEMARLNTLKLINQAKYKFHVHRRTMLLQALNSISLNNRTSSPSIIATEGDIGDQEIEPSVTVISRLTSQLSETTAAMDVVAADLVTIATHQSQISTLMSTHWGSALAIALRKLNSSYHKRTQELKVAAERIAMLEAEVAEAWMEADRVAAELDALEKFADAIPVFKELEKIPEDDVDEADHHPDLDLTGELCVRPENHEDMTDLYHYAGEAVIEKANVVSVPQSLRPMSEPTSPAFAQFATTDASNDKQPELEITQQRPLSLTIPNSLHRRQSIDAISSRSTPSISSRRARIIAAKKRSSRASLASLRLPAHSRKGSRTTSSVGHGNGAAFDLEKQLPPLPTMPAMSDLWAAVSSKIQRRRSDLDGIVASSFNSQTIAVEQSTPEIEVVPRDKNDVPSIPPVWLNPDGRRHSVLKQSASASDATPTKGQASTGLLSPEDRIHTLIRHGSESVLSSNPFAHKYPAPSCMDTPSESEVNVSPMAFAPNSTPISAIQSTPRVVTGSRFYESPSIMSPGNDSPSTPRIQRYGTMKALPVIQMPRLTKFKTMTRKYSLALHPFGIKKVETH